MNCTSHWNDPSLGIELPIACPVVSKKDGDYPRLNNVSGEDLPKFAAKAGGDSCDS